MSDDLVGGRHDQGGGRGRWTKGSRARQLRVAAVALAAVVALAIGGPRLSLHADAPLASKSSHGQTGAPEVQFGVAAVRWPLRGDLAADDSFVASAMHQLQKQRPGVAWPLYAGRLPDGSRLLLAGAQTKPGVVMTSVSAVHVPAQRSGAAGTVSDAAVLTDPEQTLGWATRGRDGEVYAVTLGPVRPVRLQLSPYVDFSDRGTPSRVWQTESSDRGVVIADLGPRSDPSVAVRSLGLSTVVTPVLIPVAGMARTPAERVVVDGTDQPGYRGPRADQLRLGLFAETDALLDLGLTTQRVIWSGVPWASRHFALVLIARADGRRFQALVGEQAGDWFPAGLRALGTQDPDQLPWLLEPFTTQDPTLLIFPTGAGSLRYQRGERRARMRIPPEGVVALFEPASLRPSAAGARVQVYGPTGRLLMTTVLPATGFDDPLAVDRG